MKKIVVAVLVSLFLLAFQSPVGVVAAGCSIPNPPFVLTNAMWGVPGSPAQVQPGDKGVPLTVSVLYASSCPLLEGSFSLALSAGFTATNPEAGSTVYLENLQPYSVTNLVYYLNLASQPLLNVGNWFTSSISVAITPDGSTYYYSSVNVGLQVLGRVDLTFEVDPRSLVAGQVNDLTLTIRNNGTGAASQVSTSVTSPSALSILGSVPELGAIPASSSYTRTVPVYVPTTAAGQSLFLAVSCTYVDPYSNTRMAAQTVDLFSPAGPEFVNIGVVQSLYNLTAGAVTPVTFTVENTGTGTASNLTISVGQSQLLSVLDLPPRIPSLPPSSQTSFPLELYAGSGAAGSALGLAFTVTYQDPYGITKVFTQNLGFYSPNPNQLRGSPLSIQVEPNVLKAGKTNNLTVTFGNVGGVALNNVTVTFASPTASFTWLSPNQAEAKEPLPGGNFTVQGSLFDPSQASSSTVLQLSITYYQGKVLNQEVRTVGLLSRGEIDIAVTGLTVLPQTVGPGQIVSMTVTVTNLGIIAATGVTADFEFPPLFRPLGSSITFIGDMQVDSPSTITVSSVVSNSTSPGTYSVPVRLAYYDNLRTPMVQTLNVNVTVVSAAEANSGVATTQGGGLIRMGPIFYLGIAAIVIAVSFLLVRHIRKPKLKP